MNTVIYHQAKPNIDCPDGICAAWIVNRKFGKIDLIPDSYLNQEDYEQPNYRLPFDPKSKEIILVDFSYPQIVIERILKDAKSLTILDHHKSRANDISALSDRILGGYQPDECGATFAWKFYFPSEPAPWFLKYVRQRDIGADGYYEGEIPESEAIATAMSSRRRGKIGREAFSIFDELLSLPASDLLAEGMPEIEERNKLVNAEINAWNGQTLEIEGEKIPFVLIQNPRCFKYYSIVGTIAARTFSDSPYVAVANADEPKHISLRRRKDGTVDCSAIAKRLGGGGQERAAGFRLA